MKKLAVILVVLAMAGLAQAAVLFSENFDDIADGPLGNDANWTTSWPGVSFTVGAAGAKDGAKGVVHTSGGPESADTTGFTQVLATDTNNVFRASFDGYIGTPEETVTQQDIKITVHGGTAVPPFDGSNWINVLLSQYDPVGAESMGVYANIGRGKVDGSYVYTSAPLHDALSYDTWYNLWIEIDHGTGDVSMGWTDGVNSNQVDVQDDAFKGLEPAYVSIYSAIVPTGDSGSATVRLDNVLVEAIPEPATLAVLAIGGLLALLRRRH